MAIGGFSKSRNLLNRKRLQKRQSVRRILLESLEARQLLTVGPQLLGVQPNTGDLLENGEVLNVSPRELTFRFDDASGIDPETFSGIRVVRSGADGIFERATLATDFSTSGQTLVEFYAREAGETGNGIELRFTKLSRFDTRAPRVSVDGRIINIELNSNPSLETRVEDLLQAFDVADPSQPGADLVYALRLRGSQTIAIGQSTDTNRSYFLGGANSSKASTDFGLGSNTEVRLIARESGNAGLGIVVNVTARDRGGSGNPIVTVSGKTINVELNSNVRFATTVQEFVDALNASDSLSSALIEAQLVSGSGVSRIGNLPTSYSPILLGGVSDIEVTPAFVGLGDTDREVIMRFAEDLPDDRYRIEILGQGTRTLRNIEGEAFNQGVSQSIAFELDLGAQVESVVPQPVSRDASGNLVQARNRIDVYLNNDDMIDVNEIESVNGIPFNTFRTARSPMFFQSSDIIVFKPNTAAQRSVLDVNFYQLFHTADSLDNTDDTRILPASVRYYPDADRVLLTFNRNLDALVDGTGAPLGPGELRLRVGSNESQPLPPVSVNITDPGNDDEFDNANDLSANWTPGAGGSQSILIDSDITNQSPLLLDFPGGSDEPGNRQIRHQDNLRLTADNIDGTSVVFYNFQNNLGVVSNTNLTNAITEQQKVRVREIFSIYERYLGVRFVESDSLGLTVAVGDMRAISPFEEIAGSGTPGVVELNAVGGTYYEAGFLQSNGQLGTVLDIQDFAGAERNEFAGEFQRAAMQAIGRLLGLGLADEVNQLTIQSFDSVFAPGVGTEIILPGDVDIVHGQYLYRPDSKDIDLYQFTLPSSGQISIEAFAERMATPSLLDTQIRLYQENDLGGWEEIASNDDYYSSDSFIELDLEQGNYIVGVSASGNDRYDPTIGDTGIGGRSEGGYQLRMDFAPPAASVLRDATGTAFDGDRDGAPAGVSNFWFRPSGPSNTKFVDKTAAAGGDGSLAAPYNQISAALDAAQPGDVVRIVGNGGADDDISTVGDNVAYEIGFNSLGTALPDGGELNVPRDVSVMIDAGAILKMRRSRVGVGSSSVNVDRSGGSLLVLGTPNLVDSDGSVLVDSANETVPGSVYFTSLDDNEIGAASPRTPLGSTPQAGEWGGIDFRNRIDATRQDPTDEDLGIFLNSIQHADIRYGGGQVVVDGVSQSITPVQMIDSRPTIVNSTITNSAEAAMSATPNSFLESNFQSPAEQAGGSFTVDYDRVGPEIHGNTIVENSLNGIQIRVRTGAGSVIEQLTVQGRFDDNDIVHLLPENLEIAGTPGGVTLLNNGPSSSLVSLTPQVGGTLALGQYNYRFTTIENGIESVPSGATATIAASGSIVLQNVPVQTSRIYRSGPTGEGPYTLVAEVTGSSTTFLDTGTDLGTILPSDEELALFASRTDARLAIDAGTVIKSQGSRIDVAFGSQLIAEGQDGLPVIFTSLNDSRYGAGGTFDTANRGPTGVATEGDWGGLYIGHTSSASLDNTVVAFGGGTTRVEGGFSSFNAVEVHQGDLRLTNSRLEDNAEGASTSTDPNRGGRGTNSEGVIFIRGSQPIIASNIIQDNLGSAISADVGSLNYLEIDDPGRSTGALDLVEGVVGNQGPLVAFNQIDNNPINGFVVRGGNLNTEGVWDDTDIVHVVNDEIVVSDHHAYGGLRLKSANDESLVVKLNGGDAGFTATGVPLDNADRIGGSVQLVGTPDHPVVLTSLDDCSVGAGFTVDGVHQTDTNNTGFCSGADVTVNFADVIVVIDESASMGFAQQFSIDLIADLDASLLQAGIGLSAAGGNQFGLVGYGAADPSPRAVPLGPNNRLFGTSQEYAAAANTLTTDGAIEDGYEAIHFTLDTYDFRQGAEKFIILVTNEDRDIVDASLTFDNTLARLQAEGVTLEGIVSADFRDQQGNIALGLDADSNAYLEDGAGGFTTSPNGSVTSFFDTTVTDYIDMVFETRGIAGDINQIQAGGLTAESFGNAIVSTIVSQAGGNPAAAGDWRSVLLDNYSNDRNVATVTESESPLSSAPGINDTPSTGQFLGNIAPDLKSGDENQRLGFHIEADISEPGDVDVYSFRADAGTEVWLDIDRTNNSLDTVVELVDANGRTLALSDSSLAEEGNPSLLYRAPELAEQSVNPLRKSAPEFYFESAQGTPKDLYSTNPKDAGFRVRLPGEPGANNLYHVRVRSSNLKTGDPASQLLDQSKIADGLTHGSYLLQIRLDEIDEVPGSSVDYADIRFATNGISLRGVPGNSPLLGENSEVEVDANGNDNDLFPNAQPLGNILTTNRQAISVAGNLDDTTDVDWFSFVVGYERLTPTALREYFSTVIDIDYADGIGRPDTSLYVFDAAGNLILGGLGSGLVDDQVSPVAGAAGSDLARGSFGELDPYIGAYELPAGTYFLAVTNSDMVPEVLAQYTDPNSLDPEVRLQPIEGVELIAEDHIGFSGGSTAADPQIPVLFPQSSINEFNLADTTLYVTQDNGTELTSVHLVNPFTGERRGQVGRGGFDVQSVDFRPNGELRGFDRTIESQVGGNVDRDTLVDYINIDPGTGQFTATPAPLETNHLEPDGNGGFQVVASDDGFDIEAVTFAVLGGQERGFYVGNRPTPFGEVPSALRNTRSIPNVGFDRPFVTEYTNVIFEFDENTGLATSAPLPDKQNLAVGIGTGTAERERGRIETRSLDAAGRPITSSTQLVTREVTTAVPGGNPILQIRDGDSFIVTDSGGFNTRFEFNTGPEVLVNYDPVVGPRIVDGMTFTLDGDTYEFDLGGGVTPGNIQILLEADATTRELVDAIASSVDPAVTVSFDGGRMNFSGATAGDFSDLVVGGVFTDLGADGTVASGSFSVDILALDTAETVAARIVQEVVEAGIPGLSATATGDLIQFFGVEVTNPGPLVAAGIAPGGLVTGITVIGNTMYAVSDAGGLYEVFNPTALRTGDVGSYVESSYDLLGINFVALEAGPVHAVNGQLSQILFGLDSAGTIHAFDTNGELQPIFANGASSVSTGLTNASGLAFSTLDFNLWHVTGQRGSDPGHGLPNTPNGSRGNFTGGSSLYFGFESPGANGVFDLGGANSPGITNSYDFPGGAAGALESETFDLSELSAADLPTLYFTYRFDTEQAQSDLALGGSADDYMRDSLRVYASGEDGQWILLATNNDPVEAGGNAGTLDDEFDPLLTGNSSVQPLHDNTGNWRQARVPLELFAGQRDVRLRVEFSSAGGFGYGLPGGRGPEIRTIEGDRLIDGETVVINNQRFEIEMGASLTMPSGQALTAGDTVTIEGIRYVFTDGSITVSAPDIAVPFASNMTAAEVAVSLQQAVLGGVPPFTVLPGVSFTNESNEVISSAEGSGIDSGNVRLQGAGQIGDNASLGAVGEDVDMIRIDVDRAAEVTVEIQAAAIGSSLDSYLRVFDAEGRALTDEFGQTIENDNQPGTSDSFVTFVAPETGTYYIGVSGAGNDDYNPTVEGTASDGSTGNYNIAINVRRRLVPHVAGNRVQLDGASSVVVPTGSPLILQGADGSTGTPVYVDVTMDKLAVAEALQSAVASFFSGGNTSAYPIRNNDTLDLTGLVNYSSFDFLTGQPAPSTTDLDAGPFGATTTFVGDAFSAFNTSTNFDGTTSNFRPGTLGGQNNAFEGVYLDDFIIGIAGRGEQVMRASVSGPNTNFIQDPQKQLTNPDTANPEILVGPYQFEIRGGEEYGLPTITGLELLDTSPINARTSEGLSIRFNSAENLIAGDTFEVGDGTTVLTFELDDVNDGVGVQPGNIALPFNTAVVDTGNLSRRSETAEVIAAKFRDILNSPAVQARVNISANLLNNDRAGATSDTVVIIGNSSAEIPASVGEKLVSNANGGANRDRVQGQVVINAAKISNSQGFGITVESGGRVSSTDPLLDTNAPTQGSPRNTITLNTDRLAPGAVIMNSELLFNRAGGISLSGDDVTGANPALLGAVPDAAVPFTRVVNNTIVGGTVSAVTTFIPEIFGGETFDIGTLAFADSVLSYNPQAAGGPAPAAGLDDPDQAIGVPDYTGTGEPQANENVVSLGRGGQLVVQFTNNLLTGSGDANPDLMVFEVGDSEEVLVEVSADGTRYTQVGRISGASPQLDIDQAGFNRNSRLAFVRLTDVTNQGSIDGESVGADIDAVGAISSVAVESYNAGGQGISVTNSASATLLNNVIVNSNVGINVDTSSQSTVIGGTVYQRNAADIGGAATIGQFPIILGDNVPVFVSPGAQNLYPAPSSPVIDGSINSLEDRPSLVAVKSPLGLAESPILAPQFDINGQLRVDDPAVETPTGLGENVFKDRGAQDRADFIGPSVILSNPADNDLGGLDLNPAETIVELTGVTPRFFDIRLADGLEPSDPSRGTGINHATVTSSSVLVFRNNEPLVEGVDYRFGYDTTNGTIRLQPLAGIWTSESVYTIRFLNSGESVVVATPGITYSDGEQFQIIDVTGSSTTFEFDTGYVVSIPSTNGIDADLSDGTTFSLDDGSRRLTFEFDNGSGVTPGNVAVQIGDTPTITSAARAIQNTVNQTSMNLTVTEVQPGRLQIEGSRLVTLLAETSELEVVGQPGVQTVFGIQIPLEAGRPAGLEDGQTFSIDRSGSPVTFELDTNGTTLPGNIPVRFVEGSSATQIGGALVRAIDSAALGLSPVYDGDGLVRLGGDVNTALDVSNTALESTGVPAQSAAIPISIPVSPTASATDIATLIKAAIDSQSLSGISTTQFGARVVVEGSQGVAGTGAGIIGAIRDEAGNPLKPNQTDGSTTLTVFLGEGLDFGDAPAPYASTSAQNGPRHTVVTGLSLGDTVTADADAKLDDVDQDDGLNLTTQVFTAFQANAQVSVTNTTGSNAYVSMWIDFNGDGTFATTERLVASQLVTQATTTYSFAVPANATVGETYARVRLSTDPNAISLATGEAPDGEVEDHLVTINRNPFTNQNNNLDVNGDGFVSPIDVLQVVNWVNDPARPNTLQLSQATGNPPYIDVNGDGIVSAIDVSLIVNHLNSRPPSGEGEFSLGNFDAAGLADSAATQTVLASDWAPGLENLVMGTRPASLSAESKQDLAIMLAAESDEAEAGSAAIADAVASSESATADFDSFWGDLGEDGAEKDSGLSEDLLEDLLN